MESVIRVHTLTEYESLPKIDKEDYFWRFYYFATTGVFEPRRVPVYCTCEEPYNPDLPMVECDLCKEWYHTKCVGLSDAVIEAMDSFTCHTCNKDLSAIARTEQHGDR